jgi:hypothetical protein
VKLFKKIEEQLGRKLTDKEKSLVLIAYTIGKNEKSKELNPNLANFKPKHLGC